MVHTHDFVAVVRVNGQVVREMHENGANQCFLPAGTDFSLQFKNLRSQRAAVQVRVNGEDALDGHKLVIDANSTGDLLGFMKNGVVTKSFRLIPMTQEIADHRGTSASDGFVEVIWQFEKPVMMAFPASFPSFPIKPCCPTWQGPNVRRRAESFSKGSPCGSSGKSCDTSNSYTPSISEPLCDCLSVNGDAQEGLVVAGADTHQAFNSTYLRTLEPQVYSIAIKLMVQNHAGQPIETPRLVKVKINCPTCGKSNKSNMKFCGGCGTNIS